MIALARQRGDRDGPYCGLEGLYLGESVLIARIGGEYRLRTENEIATLLAAAYGTPPEAAPLQRGLRVTR